MTRNTYEIPSQAGKLAVVTGASDGLGLELATRLAVAGADLVLPVRNPRKGAAAVELIRTTALRARVTTAGSQPNPPRLHGAFLAGLGQVMIDGALVPL
jgi:NAD(P)-dependent dehydrogenase (short-subunit alcohol dehydrogenase family)